MINIRVWATPGAPPPLFPLASKRYRNVSGMTMGENPSRMSYRVHGLGIIRGNCSSFRDHRDACLIRTSRVSELPGREALAPVLVTRYLHTWREGDEDPSSLQPTAAIGQAVSSSESRVREGGGFARFFPSTGCASAGPKKPPGSAYHSRGPLCAGLWSKPSRPAGWHARPGITQIRKHTSITIDPGPRAHQSSEVRGKRDA